jgi:hypothetical protein
MTDPGAPSPDRAADPQFELQVELELLVAWRPAIAEDGAVASRELVVTLRGVEAATAHESAHDAGPLARIEAKLDLVLLLLGRAVPPFAPDRPAACRVRLTPEQIDWQVDGAAPAEGDLIDVLVLLDARAPVPVRLPARVVSVAATRADDPKSTAASGARQVRVIACFTGLAEDARDALAASVFRLHRRARVPRR